MTNADYTHLTLDRSGSMASDRDEAQGGINALVAEQFALPGLLTVTLGQFDDAFDTVQRMSSEPFEYELRPRGMTALLDTVGTEVVRTGQDLAVQREHDGWEVRFLGFDDAAWQGEALGVGTTRYANTAAGNRAVFASMSGSLTAYRDAPLGRALEMPDEIETD